MFLRPAAGATYWTSSREVIERRQLADSGVGAVMLMVRTADILNDFLTGELEEGFIENNAAKREAGLATELAPENSWYEMWYDAFI